MNLYFGASGEKNIQNVHLIRVTAFICLDLHVIQERNILIFVTYVIMWQMTWKSKTQKAGLEINEYNTGDMKLYCLHFTQCIYDTTLLN